MGTRALRQLEAGAGQSTHHRTYGHLQHFGDFLVGKTFYVSEKYRFPLGLGQGVDLADYLAGQYLLFGDVFTVHGQGFVEFDKTLALAHPLRADLVEPDRMQDRQQPAVEPGVGPILCRTLQGADTGGLDQVVGDVSLV